MYGFAEDTKEQVTSVVRSNDVPSNFTVKLEDDTALVALLAVIVAVYPAAD